MKKYFIVMTLLYSSLAFSNAKVVGNGGQTVVCRRENGDITSIEVLDSYEGRIFYQMNLDLGPANLSFEQKADLAIQRLVIRNPTRAALFSKWRRNFFDGVEFVDQPLPATTDVDPSIFPKGCLIEQIAIQKDTHNETSIHNHGPVLRIYKYLWDQLSADQKAVLVLHEIIYHEANLEESARPVRYFNQLLVSNRVQTLSNDDYLKILIILGYKEWDVFGLRMVLGDLSNIYGYELLIDQDFNNKGTVLQLQGGTQVHFKGDGSISRATLRAPQLIPTRVGSLKLFSSIEFGEDNETVFGQLFEETVIETQNGYSITCAAKAQIVIAQEGLISCSQMVMGKRFKGPFFDVTLLKPMEFKISQDMQFIFPKCRSEKVFAGMLMLQKGELQASTIECDDIGHIIVKLSLPAEIFILQSKVRIIGQLDFHNFESNPVISRFQPAEDFTVIDQYVEFPVAAKTVCSSNHIFYHYVDLNSMNAVEHLNEFVTSRDWKTPLGNKSVRKGTHVKLKNTLDYEIGAQVCN